MARRPRSLRLVGLAFTTALAGATLHGCAPGEPGGDAAAQAVPVPEPDVVLQADQTHARWSATVPPAARVASGAVVEVFTAEASDGQLSLESTAEDAASLDFDPIHPLTGPVYVEGAQPGDVLAVTLLDIEAGDWGWSAIIPGFGYLADRFPEPYYRAFEIDPGAERIDFGGGVSVPLRPFPGVMGVAPATDSLLNTIPPRANGGNMDNRHIGVGTTVYFPVFVEGGLFSIGDTHAVQGDGEVSGTAIEAPMRIRYRIEVVDGGRTPPEPEYETDEYYAVTAFATTLDEAARKATGYMIDYLVDVHGLSEQDAYMLCSLVGDLKIAEVVDVPHVLVAMHMPKDVLP